MQASDSRLNRRLAMMRLAMPAAVLGLPLAAPAQPAIPSSRVQFPKGSTGTSIQGQLKGPDKDAHDHVLRAKAGQRMTVSMSTASTSTYFNVLPPGSSGEALFAGERMGGSSWTGELPADGEYTVRVYLNRAAARQGRSASYTLKISVQ